MLLNNILHVWKMIISDHNSLILGPKIVGMATRKASLVASKPVWEVQVLMPKNNAHVLL